MKDTRSVEEQVAELTEDQKKMILKVYKYGTIFQVIVLILTIISCALAFAVGIALTMMTGAPLFVALMPLISAFAVFVIVEIIYLVVINVVCPYYSEKKLKYLKKLKKEENK